LGWTDWNYDMVRIDKDTAVVTAVGESGITVTPSSDAPAGNNPASLTVEKPSLLTFDFNNNGAGELHHVEITATQNQLYFVDQATGALGSVEYPFTLPGLHHGKYSFRNGKLHAVKGTSYPTGAPTALFVAGNSDLQTDIADLYAIAFAPAVRQRVTASTMRSCNTEFYDFGGVLNNYQADQDTTHVICPLANRAASIVDFVNFAVTAGGASYLNVYQGGSTSATLLGSYPADGDITTATLVGDESNGGCLTFRFVADASDASASGWDARVTCTPASCSDGLRNQDETGVDCGGSCPTHCGCEVVVAIEDDSADEWTAVGGQSARASNEVFASSAVPNAEFSRITPAR
jgi:hypothetical protein